MVKNDPKNTTFWPFLSGYGWFWLILTLKSAQIVYRGWSKRTPKTPLFGPFLDHFWRPSEQWYALSPCGIADYRGVQAQNTLSFALKNTPKTPLFWCFGGVHHEIRYPARVESACTDPGPLQKAPILGHFWHSWDTVWSCLRGSWVVLVANTAGFIGKTASSPSQHSLRDAHECVKNTQQQHIAIMFEWVLSSTTSKYSLFHEENSL